MSLEDQWPLPGREALRDRLLAAYAAPGRHYHDLTHLAEVLGHVHDLRGELARPGDLDAVLLAAWFHDAVYEGRDDDEERSAELAGRELAGTRYGDEVVRLVRVTKDHRPDADDRSGQVLCDADLAILAADQERYADYVVGVRKEYAHLDDAAFTGGRTRVLRDLLAEPTLFHTAAGHDRWELRARANVERELQGRAAPEAASSPDRTPPASDQRGAGRPTR